MIKVIICDGDGTLQLPSPSEEIRHLVSRLHALDIQLAVASNGKRQHVLDQFARADLPAPDIIVTPRDVNNRKPSASFIEEIQRQTGVELHEIVYLGDDDQTDIFCAINAGVLPLAAKYSTAGTPLNYGYPVFQPKGLSDFLETFGKQDEPYFGWEHSGICHDTGKTINVKALLGDHSAITTTLTDVLKEGQERFIGSNQQVRVDALLLAYLVSQLYLSDLIGDIDFITVYPGHQRDSQSPLLSTYSDLVSKLFRHRFLPNLLIRHTDAPQSRRQIQNRNIFNQFRTIHVNPKYRNKLIGKRILVLDDFTTYGYSLETARRMLLKAGAENCIGVSVAKFRTEYSHTIVRGDWNSFEPCTLNEADIQVNSERGSFHHQADTYFHDVIWSYYSH